MVEGDAGGLNDRQAIEDPSVLNPPTGEESSWRTIK